MSMGFEIIPAIDLIDGKCVRLTEGDYNQKTVYHEDPVEVALGFEAAGIRRLHLVDLDGAKAGRVVNWNVLERITQRTALEVDFGGGIKTRDDVDRVLDSGAKWATVGSIAVKNEAELMSWFETYGANRFFLGADVKEEHIAVAGWQETTSIQLIPFLQKYVGYGIQYVFCTDVSKDGRLEGPATDLYRTVLEALPGLQLIASGGVSGMQDLESLKAAGCAGAIVGKAIYEGRINLEQLKSFT
jgi:phosphoribosylformimino-5-aminoimidazole carboxamide ribotide isomerase